MKRLLRQTWTSLITAATALVPSAAAAERPQVFAGLCDASAVVALDDRFFAVAADEDNVIGVYDRVAGSSLPVPLLNPEDLLKKLPDPLLKQFRATAVPADLLFSGMTGRADM